MSENAGALLAATTAVLATVRRAKTDAKVSQRAVVARCVVAAPEEFNLLVAPAAPDLRAAGSIVELTFEIAQELAVAVTLAVE